MKHKLNEFLTKLHGLIGAVIFFGIFILVKIINYFRDNY